MRDPWIDYFVDAGLGGGIVTVLWTQASIVPTGLVARMLVTILASGHGLAVWETGNRPFRDGLNHFVFRLVWSRYWPATMVWRCVRQGIGLFETG